MATFVLLRRIALEKIVVNFPPDACLVQDQLSYLECFKGGAFECDGGEEGGWKTRLHPRSSDTAVAVEQVVE